MVAQRSRVTGPDRPCPSDGAAGAIGNGTDAAARSGFAASGPMGPRGWGAVPRGRPRVAAPVPVRRAAAGTGDRAIVVHVVGLLLAATSSRYSLKSSGLKAVPWISTDPETTAPASGRRRLARGGVTSARTVRLAGVLAFPARSTA